MSDVTIHATESEVEAAGGKPVAERQDVLDDQLIGQLVDRARAEGLNLTGAGGLLQQLTKKILESALEGELTDHLGYEKHDPAGAGSGNSRNGVRSKTVLTEVGPVEIDVPRDREGTFEPQIVRKRQRRLTGVDEMVLSLAAKGLTTGEISAHLAEVYGASVSKQTISTITDRVVEGMSEWQNRPLDPVYPVIFIDCIHVKIRDGQVANRPIYVALAVTVDGTWGVRGRYRGPPAGRLQLLRRLGLIFQQHGRALRPLVGSLRSLLKERQPIVWRTPQVDRSAAPRGAPAKACMSGFPSTARVGVHADASDSRRHHATPRQALASTAALRPGTNNGSGPAFMPSVRSAADADGPGTARMGKSGGCPGRYRTDMRTPRPTVDCSDAGQPAYRRCGVPVLRRRARQTRFGAPGKD